MFKQAVQPEAHEQKQEKLKTLSLRTGLQTGGCVDSCINRKGCRAARNEFERSLCIQDCVWECK
jgi:hypothetical protein